MQIYGFSLLDLGKFLMLCFCAVAAVGASCDRFMLLGMKPPRFWYPSLQKRVNDAASRFDAAYEPADAESRKYYASEKLKAAVFNAGLHCLRDGTKLPWFAPRRFVEELEQCCNKSIAVLQDAMTYQQSAAFMLEAATALRLARDRLPERTAQSLRELEDSFQRRLLRLQEEKAEALRGIFQREVDHNLEIGEQLGVVENSLQQLVAGTNVNDTTIFP